MSKKKAIKWKAFLVLSIILLIMFKLCSITFAVEESNTWAIPDPPHNGIQETTTISDEYIMQEATLKRGTGTMNYRTTGYLMSLSSYNTDGPFSRSNTVSVPLFKSDELDETTNTVTVQYTIKREDFNDAMVSLGVTSAQIKQNGGSIKVYLNSVFEVYNPQTNSVYSGQTDICGYQEILNAPGKVFKDSKWSPTTQTNLKYFYNYGYTVHPTLYNVKIVAIDEKEPDKILSVLRTGDSGMFNEAYPLNSSYTAPQKLTAGGVDYESSNKWYVNYTDRVTNADKLMQNATSGRTISRYILPDAEKDTNVTICMVYKRSVAEANLVINAVDRENKTIEANLFSGKVAAGEKFSEAIKTEIRQSSNVKYAKTIDYYYKYTKKGKSTEEAPKYGKTKKATDSIAFTIPEDIKDGSIITVNVYYDKIEETDINIIVKAVDSIAGVELQELERATVKAGSIYEKDVSANLTVDGRKYSYTGNWKWSYTNNSPNKPTVTKNGNGDLISFSVPSGDQVSGDITVKVYYSSIEPDGITLRTIMVSGSGGIISELSTERVARGQLIAKTAQAQKSINGATYTYLNKWDYTYLTSSGSSTISKNQSNISFNIPDNITNDSIITLRLFYELKQEVEVPEAQGPISLSLDSPEDPYGVINADKYVSPYFDSEKGIPTTESQYVYVKTKDYLLGYRLVNKTGKVTYTVPVTMNYTLVYYSKTPEEYGGPKKVTDVEPNTQYIKVEKAYSYWEIERLEYYQIAQANVYNYSLPNEGVTLNTNFSYLNLPTLSTWHSSRLEEHVQPPEEVEKGIVLNAPPIVSEGSDRPLIDYEDLTSYAVSMTGEARVRNDQLIFNGAVVLNNDFREKITQQPNVAPLKQSNTLIPDKALYTEGRVIEATKKNGEYASNGNVVYNLHPYSINAYSSRQMFSIRINSVRIHTPVICDPVVTADNDKWVQLINPAADAVQLVLDPDTTLNDFTIRINNTMQHSDRPGYYTRDFSRSYIDPVNVSYIAKKNGTVRNEVKFPFDVYVDVLEDKNPSNDIFVKAGTWYVLGRNTIRFYLPLWVQERTYTVQFRTVAANGENMLNNTETTKNSYIHSYVASSSMQFEVSGRIYGLTLYDVSDYPDWEEAFRVKDTMLFKLFEGAVDGTTRTKYNKEYAYYYTVGTNDRYGKPTGRISKYTLPLINGSHPQYKNLGVLKTGYAFRFMLDTIGEMYGGACHVKITPTFYYVDAQGKNRRQVDLYYDEEINGKYYRLCKVGEGIDLVNIKYGVTGNIYNRIPERELQNTANVIGTTYSKFSNQRSTMYSYSIIKLLNSFRTFIGWDYATQISRIPSYTDVRTATGETNLSLSKYMQRWYGTYKLPVEVHAVNSGFDVYDYMKKHGIDYSESFWLKGGYIIVNFNIVTIDKNGQEHLSYINASNYLNNGNCSMWVTEGPTIQKTDNKGIVFDFKAGDVVIYYTDKKYTDDYEGRLY